MQGEHTNLRNVVANAMSWLGNAESGYTAFVDMSGGEFSDMIEITYSKDELAKADPRWVDAFYHLVDRNSESLVNGPVLRTVLSHWLRPVKLTTCADDNRYVVDPLYVMEKESEPGTYILCCYEYRVERFGHLELPVIVAPDIFEYSAATMEALFPDFGKRLQIAEITELEINNADGARFVLGLPSHLDKVTAELPDELVI